MLIMYNMYLSLHHDPLFMYCKDFSSLYKTIIICIYCPIIRMYERLQGGPLTLAISHQLLWSGYKN